MPKVTLGMGLSAMLEKAQGESNASPTICQRLLLPGLQAQRGGVYFGEERGRALGWAMLVTYLDDSGKDPQNPITCLAGYAAPEEVWTAFEEAAEPICQHYIGGVPLHATDLHHGNEPYQGWSVLKKQSFVAQLCMALYPQNPLGVSFSVRKASYLVRATEAILRGFRKRTATPYTFCMQGILNWLLSDVQLGKLANEVGLALILEAGNEHNEEAKLSLDAIKKLHDLDHVKSLSFLPKSACRAIQMADLFAYYTRRHNRHIDIPGQEPPVDPVLAVLLEGLRHRSFIATDFGPEAKGSRFFRDIPSKQIRLDH